MACLNKASRSTYIHNNLSHRYSVGGRLKRIYDHSACAVDSLRCLYIEQK